MTLPVFTPGQKLHKGFVCLKKFRYQIRCRCCKYCDKCLPCLVAASCFIVLEASERIGAHNRALTSCYSNQSLITKPHISTMYSITTFYDNYIKSLNEDFTNCHFQKIDTHSKQMIAGIKVKHIMGLLFCYESS